MVGNSLLQEVGNGDSGKKQQTIVTRGYNLERFTGLTTNLIIRGDSDSVGNLPRLNTSKWFKSPKNFWAAPLSKFSNNPKHPPKDYVIEALIIH